VPVQPPDDDFPNTEPLTSGSDLERFADDSVGPGLAVAQGSLYFSAVEAARVICSGGSESSIHPPSAVVATLDVMDRIRAEIGVV